MCSQKNKRKSSFQLLNTRMFSNFICDFIAKESLKQLPRVNKTLFIGSSCSGKECTVDYLLKRGELMNKKVLYIGREHDYIHLLSNGFNKNNFAQDKLELLNRKELLYLENTSAKASFSTKDILKLEKYIDRAFKDGYFVIFNNFIKNETIYHKSIIKAIKNNNVNQLEFLIINNTFAGTSLEKEISTLSNIVFFNTHSDKDNKLFKELDLNKLRPGYYYDYENFRVRG